MRDAIVSKKVATPVGPFSHAVRSDGLVYTSGQVGQDPATGKLVEGGPAAETTQVFRNIRAVLDAGGKTLDDVIKVNVYLTNMGDFKLMNDVYADAFTAPYPARTTVAVAALPLGASVEIEVVAR